VTRENLELLWVLAVMPAAGAVVFGFWMESWLAGVWFWFAIFPGYAMLTKP